MGVASPWTARRPHPQALVAIGLILLALYALRHSVSSTEVLVLVVVVPSIILHEVSHGVVALWCGDDTARRAGRLTLNPLRHVDPIGTLVLPAVLALSGLGAFGYAKPVPVNPGRMRSPRNGSLVTSLAGPATNLVLAGLSIVVLRDLRPAGTVATLGIDFGAAPLLDRVVYLVGYLNVLLAVFNLIPLPPLDGSAVVERLLPARAWPTWLTIRRWAMPALLLVVLLDPGHLLSRAFDPALRLWGHVLTA